MAVRVLFKHDECFVYRIPPESFSSAGHHALSWGLEKPLTTASIVVSEEENPADGIGMCVIKMYKGKSLFAQCEMDMKAAGAKGQTFYLQQVADSSRYWVLRIADKVTGRSAFIGFGFRDRDTATELRSAIQDSLRFLQREEESRRLQALADAAGADSEDQEGNDDAPLPPSKLSLAEGQTIKIAVAGVDGTHNKHKKKHIVSTEAEAFASIALPPAFTKPKEEPAGAKSPDVDDDWGDFTAADASDTTQDTTQQATTEAVEDSASVESSNSNEKSSTQTTDAENNKDKDGRSSKPQARVEIGDATAEF